MVEQRRLSEPPSLLPLYARAVVAGKGRRAATLPELVYQLDDQTIDVDHLARYDKLCGFTVADRVPPTYPHLLGFPLAVALMSEPEFPLPLVGLLHLRNSITVHRPLWVGERLSLQVRAAGLGEHRRGRCVDIITDALAGGQLVWSETSTYLHVESGPGERSQRPPETTEPAGAVTLVRAEADIGRRYAALSGDRNPVHLHAVAAKAFGFSSAIAHGMWVLARALATIQARLPESCTVDIAFKTPVLLPATVAVHSLRTDAGWELEVRDTHSGKPHLTGTVTHA